MPDIYPTVISFRSKANPGTKSTDLEVTKTQVPKSVFFLPAYVSLGSLINLSVIICSISQVEMRLSISQIDEIICV